MQDLLQNLLHLQYYMVSIMPSKRKLRRLLALYQLYRKEQRRSYVRMVNITRCQRGEYHSLLKELRNVDEERHHQYFRMSKESSTNYCKLLRIDLFVPKDIDFQ